MLPVPPVRMLAVRTSEGGRDSCVRPMALDSTEAQTSGPCIFALGGTASGLSVLRGA